MKKKSLQLLLLVFLFLLIGFGSHQHTSFHSLAEKRVYGYYKHNSINNIAWVQSGISYIDPYPNWFISRYSLWYQYGENALGPPDNEFALIFQDYGNGYLILDFGSDQEIIDGTGPDFKVFTQGGKYIVRIGNDLISPFEIFENETGGVIFSGNESHDLSGTDHDTVRYIQIEYSVGATVELDAVEALNYNQPAPETDPPQITGPGDISITNQTSVKVSWEVNDLHPWNYSIFIDEKMAEQGFWEESQIIYTLDLAGNNESVEITLVLDDIFGNWAEDTVTIEIGSSGNSSSFPLLPLLGGFLLLLLLRKTNNRKEKRS